MALSAVAQDMRLLLLREKGLDARYCAGIWACEMPFGLLWQTMGDASACRAEYKAPSWSWASVDVGVTATDEDGLLPVVTFLDVAIILADQGNAVGQITGGHILIQGKLLRAVLDDAPGEETEMNERWRYIARLEDPDDAGREIVQLAEEFRWNYANFDTVEDVRGEFLVLPIGAELRENPRETCWVVKSLALDLIRDQHGRLRRLGYVELNVKSREQLDAVLGAVEDRRIELV